MDAVWLNILSFLLVFTLAIISPGPNFILVAGTSLAGSRREALQTAFGVAVGSGIFALSGLVGLLVLVKTLPYFDTLMPIAGGAYLLYLGIRMIRERSVMLAADPGVSQPGSHLAAFRTGLLTNLTNPKAWAFYLSMFTLMLAPGCPLWGKALLAVLMFLISYCWYTTVVLLITDRRTRPLFDRSLPAIQTVLGVSLVAMGGRLLLTLWTGV